MLVETRSRRADAILLIPFRVSLQQFALLHCCYAASVSMLHFIELSFCLIIFHSEFMQSQ